MEIVKKLTKKTVESIKPDPLKDVFVWDSELKGFGLRVFSTGRRTYFLQYRNSFGRTGRHKLGVHGVMTAEAARDEAKRILGDIARGEDPADANQKAKVKPTIEQLAQQYLEIHSQANKKQKSYSEDVRMLEKHILAAWRDKKVEEITPQDVQLLHHQLKDTPYMANRVRALVSTMFNMAVQWRWVTVNPVDGTTKYQEHKRTRWLNDQELQRLWDTLDAYHNQSFANVIRLLVLTGSRRSEVLHATWDQFDLDKGVWTKPAHTTKQKKMEHLPLSSQALEILKQMKETASSPFLFPGKVPGKPLQEIKKAWETIRKRTGFEEIRLHDLRHTHASHLVSSGLSLSIVGKLLGHTQASTTQRYAHLADAPLREAAEFFGSKVGKLTDKSLGN
jgi:integrase